MTIQKGQTKWTKELDGQLLLPNCDMAFSVVFWEFTFLSHFYD